MGFVGGFSLTSRGSRSQSANPFSFVCLRPLYSQCVGPLTPHTEHKTGSTHRTVCDVHPEFELWMSTVCLHLLQMIIIIIFRCNIESLIWAQNYASVVVGDYFSAGTLVHVGRSRLLINNQKCCKKTQWASPQLRNVTGGLDEFKMLLYFSNQSKNKSLSYWYFCKVLFVPLLHDRAVKELCRTNVWECVSVSVCSQYNAL